MGSRGIQVALVAVVILFGVVAAVAVNGARRQNQNQTAVSTSSPSASVQASPSPSPSPSASPSPEASPSASPSELPSPVPTSAPVPTSTPTAAPAAGGGGGTGGTSTRSSCGTAGSGGAGPAGYPRQVSAGAQYSYCGPRALVVHATDTKASGTSACAGINENTQAFPSGYEGVFFVGVQFADSQIVSAGYIRTAAGRRDFGSIQNATGSQKSGTLGADPGAGSHTYCVTSSGSQWALTRDGTAIYTTAPGAEPATDLGGATIKFDSDIEPVGSPAAATFTLTVPGFHDIIVGGIGPRELRGAAFYS